MCFYNTTSTGPNCISPGQYILDHLCSEGGTWTTRTSKIAEAILSRSESAGGSYVISCDEYQTALNQYDYPLTEYMSIRHFLYESGNCTPNACFNNFCVLRDVERNIRAVGSSLNPDALGNSGVAKIYVALNISDGGCAENGQNIYQVCANRRLNYNSGLKSFIYSKDNMDFSGGGDIFSDLIKKLFSWLGRLFGGGSSGQVLEYKVPNFDTLYIMKNGGKRIFAMMQSFNDTEILLINYTGFSTDFCGEFDKANLNEYGKCKNGSRTKYISASRKSGGYNPLFGGQWINFTLGLRFALP